MPCVILICEVNLGIGHLVRMLTVASALSRHFRVVLIVVTANSIEIEAPASVKLHVLRRPSPPSLSAYQTIGSRLLEIATVMEPVSAIVECFPFGRHVSLVYLLPFLKGLRSMYGKKIKILCSIRDIQDGKLEVFQAESVARLANQLFDGILVHSDPCLTRLEDTFAAVADIRIPIYYTNYVSRARSKDLPPTRSKTILVSAGGGRGGEALLRCAVAAAETGLLQGYRMRILGGKLLPDRNWKALVASCSSAPDSVELLRWVPDLFTELRIAAVSVSRCGYNTAQDLLASGVPALVVPFATPADDEQRQRARILSRIGAVRMLTEDDMTAESLAMEILRTLDFRPAATAARHDGADQTCNIVTELVASAERRN